MSGDGSSSCCAGWMRPSGRLAVSVLAVVALAVLAVGAGFVGVADATASQPACETVGYEETAGWYEVETVDQLQCLGENHADAASQEDALGSNYVLVADIDASETATWNDGRGFDPIGSRDGEFTGTFDGDGHTISGLTIDRGDEDRVGLFGYVREGTVEDVGLEAVAVTGKWQGVGGLVGYNWRGEVTESHVTGDVTGDVGVGGLVGGNYYGVVRGSSATADVAGGSSVGGLVGGNTGEVSESYATGNVSGDRWAVGGLVGNNYRGTVSEAYATGDVSGDRRVGGLVGDNHEGEVSEAYAIGDVFGNHFVGGLVGVNRGEMTASYATGDVSGDGGVGGLVGGNFGTIDGPYWDVETTGQADSDGGTGLSTAEMVGSAAESNMDALDFDDVWEPVTETTPGADDDGYPILQALDADPQLEGMDVNPDDEDDSDDEADSIPGFGLAPAVITLVIAAALGRRRAS